MKAPVVHSLINGEIAEIVLNQVDNDNNDDEENITKMVPKDDMVKICNGFIEG